MALEERTRIREVLFVQDDTTLEWAVHQVPITEILSGGAVVAARYGRAESLTVEGAGQVLKPAVVSLAAERDALKKRVKELEAELREVSTTH